VAPQFFNVESPRVPPSSVPLLGSLEYQIKPRELMKVFDDDGKVVDRRANHRWHQKTITRPSPIEGSFNIKIFNN
jgi:hypothetical protein